jgi:hypothetical protein
MPSLPSSHKIKKANENQASVVSDIMSITLSLSASNVKGNTKRAVVNTMYFIGYCAGCVGTPQLWLSIQKPRYTQD